MPDEIEVDANVFAFDRASTPLLNALIDLLVHFQNLA